MNCPECGHPQNDVLDSRKNPENVWRRRQCRACKATWVTEERMSFSDNMIKAMMQDLDKASRAIGDVRQTINLNQRRGGTG